MTAREAGGAIPMDIATKRKLISNGKERGYITYEELNDVLPEKGSEEQIEEFMKRLAELDIKLIDGGVKESKLPNKILISSSYVEVQKMTHQKMNLFLEYNQAWKHGWWICDVKDPDALPPFIKEAKVSDGEYVEVLNESLEWVDDTEPWGIGVWKIDQQRGDKEPIHDDAEREEIAEFIQENAFWGPNILKVNYDDDFPYLTGWETVDRRIKFVFPIELRAIDVEEFDKNNILKTIVNDDGDEVIDWDQHPTIVKFEDIGAWLAYKESRE